MSTHVSSYRQHRTAGPASTDSPAATAYTTVGNSLMKMQRALPRRLLGVWAHPDDEAYLSAGLMARVVAAGGSVTVLTATRGEKGTDDPTMYDQDAFGDHRADELRASLAALGVTDVRFLGLRDGECDLADDESVIGDISHVVSAVEPDAIVTFGPDGISNHADHRAVSRWTTEAWRRYGRGELLYAAMTHDFAALHRTLHDELGLFADAAGGRPVTCSRSCVSLECALSDDELDRKRRALAAHATQTTGLASVMGEATYRTWWRDERFRAPTPAEIARCELSALIQDATPTQRELAGVA